MIKCHWQLWRDCSEGWTWWLGSVEAVSWATVVEIFLNRFSTTCAFHLSDFRLLTQFIGNVVLYSSTRSSCPFSFRMYEEVCTCSLISLLSYKEVRKYTQVPGPICGVSCYAFYSTGKRNITQRGTVTQYGTKECISVMYRTGTLRNILCRRSRAMPKKIGKLVVWQEQGSCRSIGICGITSLLLILMRLL